MTPHDLVLTPRGLRVLGRTLPCAIGRTGITATKREGDGATPAGTHRITGCLYRPDRLARPNGWAQPIGPRDLWSDTPTALDYNRQVRAPYAASHEALRRADRLYDIVLLTDWNAAGTPHAGSAIFLHRWRKPRHPTEGCLALRADHLAWLVARIAPGTRLIVPAPSSR
ncbi:L,D-transpeptidase family protein [Psychromarinibacter sp. C21-152]|uniref:L,D-transpeptidase family protein n=1 Tax=Psychromarinibacter sediminicola TaxID=3033385 RepID=A0AAE3NQP0_9RHOB|nr:L,D-transpeptidase family protein [Psychromarinibacter sediminicola]MDF0600694.1 L,D-transpeptidase family protein [Psychromarinibacter sediminicola]